MKKCLLLILILVGLTGIINAKAVDFLLQENSLSILTIKPSELFIAKGKKSNLVPSYDQTKYGKSVKYDWNSSNNEIVSINNGTVQAKTPGNAVITCTATFKDGTVAKQTSSIIVFQPVESFTSKTTKLTISAGQTIDCVETAIKPRDASYKDIIWSSTDDKIATIDKTGRITGVSGGKVTIVGLLNEPGVKNQKSVKIQVVVTQSVSTIVLSTNNLTVGKGKSQKITADIFPSTATNPKISWSSSDERIATVKNGIITGRDSGECTITAKALDGSDALDTCKVSVIQYVTIVEPYATKLFVHVGQTIYCGGARALPEDAKIRRVVWSPDDSGYVSVTQGGSITGKTTGTCKVYASAIDGSDKKASVKVFVEPANPITLESIGFGIYRYDLLGLTVKNLCQYRSIRDFNFEMTMYNFGGTVVNKGSFSLGKQVSLGAKSKQTIKRDVYGVSQAYKVTITITDVLFSNGEWYSIPNEARETWSFTRN